jgi:hypothetical protein
VEDCDDDVKMRFIVEVDEDFFETVEGGFDGNVVKAALTAVETFIIGGCEFVDLATTDVEAFANI